MCGQNGTPKCAAGESPPEPLTARPVTIGLMATDNAVQWVS